MGLGNRIARAHSTVAKTAGVVSSDYWDFQPGQRVMTREGIAGTVTAVSDGPVAGNEEYEVTLDGGLGGGAYAPGELAPLDPPLAAEAATKKRPSNWQHGADEEVGDENEDDESSSTTAANHTAADDYPELGDILERRPNHEHALPVKASLKHIASLDAEGQQVEAGFFDKAIDRMYHNLPPQFQTVEKGYVSSYDWCRFRRASHCWYSYQIDDALSHELGRVIWIPQDRGMCPRIDWDAQKACPIGEPGPHTKDPNARPEATLPYDAGGQRLSSLQVEADWFYDGKQVKTIPELLAFAEEHGIAHPPLEQGDHGVSAEKIRKAVYDWLYDRFAHHPEDHRVRMDTRPDHGPPESSTHHDQESMDWLRGRREPHTPEQDRWIEQSRERSYERARQQRLHNAAALVTEAELQADPEFRFHFTAAWSDVRAKAKRIRSEGGVRIIAAPTQTDTTVSAEVRGDHNIYETTIMREPGKRSVASWACGCAWSSYSWGRSGRWKRYEGRMCSHALALTFEVQARGMFGRTIREDRMMPPWRMDPTIPVVQPSNYPKPKKRHGSLRPVSLDKDLEVPPAVLVAQAALGEGQEPNEVMAALVELGCADAPGIMTQAFKLSVPVRWKGFVHRLVELLPGKAKLDNGKEVPLTEITYPTYDPRLGLNPKDNTPHLAAAGADTKGVMVCFRLPDKLAYTLSELGTEDVSNMHITLGYFGKPDEVDADALRAGVKVFADKAPSLMAEVSGLGTFENDDENVLIATWDIPGIDRFRSDLMKYLTANGVEPYNNHGFTPHCTLSYSKEPFRKLPKLPDAAKSRFAITDIWVAIGDEWEPIPLNTLGAAAASLQTEAMSLAEPVGAAVYLQREAKEHRPQVEADVQRIAAMTGGKAITGFFNVKGTPKMTDKIAEYARIKGIPASQAMKCVNDALRYTITWPTDEYARGAGRAWEYLSKRYGTTAFKNYWIKGDPYQGINTVFICRDGFPWEMQFHTPESFDVKEHKTHALYDIVEDRQHRYTVNQRKSAYDEMVRLAGQIPQPGGVIPMGQFRMMPWVASKGEHTFRYFLLHAENDAVPTTLYRMDTNHITWEYLSPEGKWERNGFLARHLLHGGTNHTEIEPGQAAAWMQMREAKLADLASDWSEALTAGYESGEVDADAITWFAPSEAGQSLAERGAFADLHDEPEPALPETDGAEEEADEVRPGSPRLAWLMAGEGQTHAENADIAAAARDTLAKLSGKVFSPAEQKQIIDEGAEVTAANLGDLDIAGTHYEALEAALSEEEEDEAWLS